MVESADTEPHYGKQTICLHKGIWASGKENIWGFGIHGGSQNQSPELPKGHLCSLKKQ